MADADTSGIVVLCNAPDAQTAHKIASSLVESRLAACVNVLGECRSVYSWEGKIEDEQEVPMLIKTTSARFPEVEKRIVDLHPYDVPEVIAIPIVYGHRAYLDFIISSCEPG